jgi:hypothetical protein
MTTEIQLSLFPSEAIGSSREMENMPHPNAADHDHVEWDSPDIDTGFLSIAAEADWDDSDIGAEFLAKAAEDKRRETYHQADIKRQAEKLEHYVRLELETNARVQPWQRINILPPNCAQIPPWGNMLSWPLSGQNMAW